MIRDRMLAPTGPLFTRWTDADAILSNSFGCWKPSSRDLPPAFTTTKECEVEPRERQQNRGDEDRHGGSTAHAVLLDTLTKDAHHHGLSLLHRTTTSHDIR